MKATRKEFLLGLGGATLGAPLGAWGIRPFIKEPISHPHDGPSVEPRHGSPPLIPPIPEDASPSYAQSGEDLIVKYVFTYLGHHHLDYLDIGAHHPIRINNTYLFYKMGFRGVLVEPNAAMCEQLRAVRPDDKTLVAGIGASAQRAADYYMMSESSWNTFSKEEAERSAGVTGGKITIEQVVQVPLLDINEVIDEHFRGTAPSFVSIDVEGMDLALLRAIDYARFRPKVICVETLVSGTNRTVPEIPAFMEQKGYVVRGSTFVNTIFVDSELL